MAADDARHLRRALRLAARGRCTTAPNPRVGAVVTTGGEVVGEGWHRRAGEPHAEVIALAAAGERARGATLYVNLEPCSHHGRTPPCAEAVVAAAVRRVVVSHLDPNPRVAGAGVAALRAAGVEVEVGTLAPAAVRLNLPFLVPHLLARPAVTLKWAMSLDGKIALANGESRWISGPSGRRWGLRLREEHDAILVGSGTALRDDPLLTRRLGLAAGPIVRVVLDRRLRLRASARMLADPAGASPVLVYTEADGGAAAEALRRRGAEVVRLTPATLAAVLADLHRRGIASLLVEGGGQIHGAFVAAGLFDHVAVDVASILVGGATAPGPVGDPGAAELASAPRLEGVQSRRRGDDVLVEGLRPGLLGELIAAVVPEPKPPSPRPVTGTT